MIAHSKATIEDLYKIDGKAELVEGTIVREPPTGDGPGTAAGNIFLSLAIHARNTGNGRAYADNVGFRVDLPNRDAFSPDAAYYFGPRAGMKFLEGAPAFAAEVRSEGDYGATAEAAMAAKRADYFAAGTQVVWDVDLLSPAPVRKYTAESPDRPREYRRGETAAAEPALSDWRFEVNDLFI